MPPPSLYFLQMSFDDTVCQIQKQWHRKKGFGLTRIIKKKNQKIKNKEQSRDNLIQKKRVCSKSIAISETFPS